ncbi:hypothetical protein C8J57DRAFT_1061972, partial [Mycena rebaudengoi]
LVCLRSTVTDGLTIGHPCCAVQDCQNRLRTVKNLFCEAHQTLKKQYSVTTSNAEVEPGFRTCPNAEHRNIELHHYERGKAMFQLKSRLKRLKGSTLSSSLPEVDSPSSPSRISASNETVATGADLLPLLFEDEEPELNIALPNPADDDDEIEMPSCEGKSAKGNRTLRARFTRWHTHNEQLCVTSCGIILARATFFGSEAPNGVRVGD